MWILGGSRPFSSPWRSSATRSPLGKGKGTRISGQETNEDTGGPLDQVIPLSSLPEPVAARYYHVRRKMEKMRDKASEKIEDMKRQKLIESGIGALELLA